jgi:hypothetical protein
MDNSKRKFQEIPPAAPGGDGAAGLALPSGMVPTWCYSAPRPDGLVAWRYYAGGFWRETTDPAPWPEGVNCGEDDLDRARQEAGYPLLDRFGLPYSRARVTLYGDGAEFLIEVSVVDLLMRVLTDWPGLIELLPRLLGLVEVNGRLEEAEAQDAERRAKRAAKGKGVRR